MGKKRLAQHLRNNETKHIIPCSFNEENKMNYERTTEIVLYENTEKEPI